MYTDKQRRQLIKSMKSLRRDGYQWKEIAKLFGYADRGTAQSALIYHQGRAVELKRNNTVKEKVNE